MANFSLLAKIGADTKGFQRGLDKADKKTGKFKKSLGSLKGAIAGIGFTAAVKGAANYVTEMENSARLSGLATEEFQKLAFAAKSVGLQQDKVADIIKDVNDKIGDFLQTGAGPMADFFEQIAPQVGVTADQFRDLNGRDALQLYVSSLEKANLSQNEMTFYMEAIASDATLLLPLLEDNGKQLGIMADRAERLGAVIDQKTTKAIKEMNVSLQQGGMVMLGAAAKGAQAYQEFMTFLFAKIETARTGVDVFAAMAEKEREAAAATEALNKAQKDQIQTQEQINKLVDEQNKKDKEGLSEKRLEIERKLAVAMAIGDEARVEKFKQQLELAKKIEELMSKGFSAAEAADLAGKLVALDNKKEDPEDTRGDFARELSGKELAKAANMAGKEDKRRFERMADGTFQEFIGGKKGKRVTEEQLRAATEGKIESKKTDDLLEQIKDSLQGKFVNE